MDMFSVPIEEFLDQPGLILYKSYKDT